MLLPSPAASSEIARNLDELPGLLLRPVLGRAEQGDIERSIGGEGQRRGPFEGGNLHRLRARLAILPGGIDPIESRLLAVAPGQIEGVKESGPRAIGQADDIVQAGRHAEQQPAFVARAVEGDRAIVRLVEAAALADHQLAALAGCQSQRAADMRGRRSVHHWLEISRFTAGIEKESPGKPAPAITASRHGKDSRRRVGYTGKKTFRRFHFAAGRDWAELPPGVVEFHDVVAAG